jgi:hypothetical protein
VLVHELSQANARMAVADRRYATTRTEIIEGSDNDVDAAHAVMGDKQTCALDGEWVQG